GHFHELADVAQRDRAAAGCEPNATRHLSLLFRLQVARMAGGADARRPLEAASLSALDRVAELRRKTLVAHLAAHHRRVTVHRRKFFAELEVLAFLATRAIACAFEHGLTRRSAQRAPQFSCGGMTEQDRAHSFLERGHTELRPALAVQEAA